MVIRERILELIPHQGAMCVLDAVIDFSTDSIVCTAWSHLSPDNPLRNAGQLHALCGIEYGLQAAALHGALLHGHRQPTAYLGALRDVAFQVDRLDERRFGALRISATRDMATAQGSIYRFALATESGLALLSGRATLMLPPDPT